MVSAEQIKEWWNVLSKLTNSERWTFLLIMLVAFCSIVITVVLYIRSVDWLVEKYNETINLQQKEFLNALKELH